MRTLLAAILAFGTLLAAAYPALAHAILLESQPALRGSVRPGAVAVVFRFNSRVDARRSRVLLIRADKSETVLPILPNAPDDQILAQTDLPPGSYTLRWQVLAVDGHITRGDVPFTVAAAP